MMGLGSAATTPAHDELSTGPACSPTPSSHMKPGSCCSGVQLCIDMEMALWSLGESQWANGRKQKQDVLGF